MITAATTPTAVSFASTTLAANARGTWTVGFTSTATGALRTGDTVSVAFPNATSIFTVPASPTVFLTKGFKNCAVGSTSLATTTLTITLADNGGVCSLPSSTVAQVQILGVTSGIAGTVTAANWTVRTSADSTAGQVGASIVIAAATTPTAVSFASTTLAANARGTWTVGFTSTATRLAPGRRHGDRRLPERHVRLHRPGQRRPSSSRRASSTVLRLPPERSRR